MDERYEYVRAELDRRVKYHQLQTVAANSHVSRRTLGYILKGTRDVKISTLAKVYDYLKANESKRDL